MSTCKDSYTLRFSENEHRGNAPWNRHSNPQKSSDRRFTTRPCKAKEVMERWQIILKYLEVLGKSSSSVLSEAGLPSSKDAIRRAIYEMLTENPDDDLRTLLELAFVQLECFLPEAEYQLIKNFKSVGSLAQQIASSGAPEDIINSACILRSSKGEEAVNIEEEISERMRERLEQIRRAGRFDSLL